MSYAELLIGCGRARDKRVPVPGRGRPDHPVPAWVNLTTLDINPTVGADVVMPFDENCIGHFGHDAFNEIHAYEVLEHLGRQGDVVSFFATFFVVWCLLKPGGMLAATVPSRYSEWLWGDPGHTRVINPTSLVFLDQTAYRQCDGPHPTTMSDYRGDWAGDFIMRRSTDDRATHTFVLEAVKPARREVKL